MAALRRAGISLDAITTQLVEEGVQLFADAFDKLLGAVAGKRAAILGDRLDGQSAKLAPEHEKAVAACLESWRQGGNVRRLWAGDAALWSGSDEARWLGWLGIVGAGARPHRRALEPGGGYPPAGFFPHGSARHGRVEPGAGGSGRDLRSATRQPRASGPRFDRSGADPDHRKQDRSGPNAVHRVEQVRKHARARCAEAVFLRAGGGGGRCAGGRDRASSPSPIRGRSCRRRPSRIGSGISRSECRASAGAIRCCRISAWSRAPRWGSMSAGCSRPRKPWCTPAAPTCRRPTIRESCSARSWACSENQGATR